MDDLGAEEVPDFLDDLRAALTEIHEIRERLRGWPKTPNDSLAANWAPLLLAKMENISKKLEDSLEQVVEAAQAIANGDLGDATESPEKATSLRGHERQLILDALERFGWNQSQAARHLDITRYHLRHRVKKYGIKKPEGWVEQQILRDRS